MKHNLNILFIFLSVLLNVYVASANLTLEILSSLNGFESFKLGANDNILFFDTFRNYQYQKLPWSKVKSFNIHQKNLHSVRKPYFERHSTGLGMHRKIFTKLYFANISEDCLSNCFVMFSEHISPSFYLDIYEVDRSTKYHLYYNSSIDIEKTAYEAQNHTVLVFRPLLYNGTHYEAAYKLIWHLRYDFPSIEKYTEIQLDAPNVYLFCEKKITEKPHLTITDIFAPCPFQNSKYICNWKRLSVNTGKHMTFTLPIGVSSHSNFVYFFTVYLTLTCTAILTYIVVKSSNQIYASFYQ